MPFYFLSFIVSVWQKAFIHCHSKKTLTKSHFQRVMIPAPRKNLLESVFEVRMTDTHKPSNILLKKCTRKGKTSFYLKNLGGNNGTQQNIAKANSKKREEFSKRQRIIQKAKRINLSKQNSKNKTRPEQAPIGPQPREIRCGGSRSPWLLTNLLHLDNDASLIWTIITMISIQGLENRLKIWKFLL